MSVSADDFLYQLNNLPPDTNPFLWMSNLFKSQYLPQYSQSVKAQLYVNIGLDSLARHSISQEAVLVFSSTWETYYAESLHDLRLFRNRSFIPSDVLVIIVLLLGMIKTVDGDLPTYIGPFSLLIGFIPPLVGAIVVWSLAASFLLHSQSLRGQGTHSLDHWITPCNLLGIIPILHLLSFIPLDAVAGVRYVSAILLYRSIDTFLLSQASIWDPTSTFNVGNLLPIAPKFIALESKFSSLVPIWRGTYIFNAIAAVVLVISLTTISSLYLSSIGRLVQKGKEAQLHNSSGQKSELLDEVKQRWIGLVIGMALFDVIAAFAFALSVFASKRPLEMAETYILTSFWSTTILSFLAGGVFLWLSWVLRPELDEAERENQRNREEEADEERGLDQLASKVSSSIPCISIFYILDVNFQHSTKDGETCLEQGEPTLALLAIR
ncbi:hypothetical protein JCM5353_000513 [Sporobolomyces roseus]